MLTLYVTGLIIAVLLVPGFIFRGCFSFFLPLRKFQRTRAEEIAFAVKVSLAPLLGTLLLARLAMFSWYFPIPVPVNKPATRSAAHVVFRAAVDDKSVQSEAGFDEYTHALRQVLPVTANFVLWYYVLLAIEAAFLGWFSSKFGTFRKRRGYGWIMEKVLLPSISEWHILLTTFASPKEPARVVVADVLTTDDHLYHGSVTSYDIDKDGKLSGILLGDVFRFDRHGYVRALQNGPIANRKPYWKQIPGKNVYVFADRITNVNVNYELEAAIRIKRELGLDPTLQLEIQST